MSYSFSDILKPLGKVPRWVWILILVVSILLRVWLIVIFMGVILFVFIALTILGFIAIAEITDDDGPGHNGPRDHWWQWFVR